MNAIKGRLRGWKITKSVLKPEHIELTFVVETENQIESKIVKGLIQRGKVYLKSYQVTIEIFPQEIEVLEKIVNQCKRIFEDKKPKYIG